MMTAELEAPINTTSDLLRHGWELHASVVAGCIGLLVWYAIPRPRRLRQATSFTLGVTVMLLALISPLDPLGDEYLFSAHMLQHLLLLLIVPPLLLAGLTRERVQKWMTQPWVHASEQRLGDPVMAWLPSISMMLLWHLPVLYNAANASEPVHILEHMLFLVTGCMFWWPIFTPLEQERMQPAKGMLYLFGAAVVSTLLGIFITFLPVGYYVPYVHPVDEMGALHLVRDVWRISAEDDQKLAGLLMWVPGCTVYFGVMLMELARWFRIPGADKQVLLAAHRRAQQEVSLVR
jgi:cytochrome c oxidase assembly factor CtaG